MTNKNVLERLEAERVPSKGFPYLIRVYEARESRVAPIVEEYETEKEALLEVSILNRSSELIEGDFYYISKQYTEKERDEAREIVEFGSIDPSFYYPDDAEGFFREAVYYADAERLLKGFPSIAEAERFSKGSAIPNAKSEVEESEPSI